MTQLDVAPRSVAQRAAIGAGWVIAWRVATRNIGLISTLILVRLLQPGDFGLVALASGFINSVDALSEIGVQDALVRVPALDRDLYDTGFGLTVLRGGLTALLIAAVAWPVANFFAEPRLANVMLALSAGTLIGGFENIAIVDFRRDLAFRKEFNMQLWSRICGATTTIAMAVVFRSYWALVAGILVYRTARLVQSYLMSAYRPHITIRAWRRIIGFSLWTWGQTLLYQARERSDSIVIGRLLGTAWVGMFSVGLELGLLPTTELVEPLGRALFPSFVSLHNRSENLGNLFCNAVGLGFLMILPAGLGISMIAEPMVRLSLGEEWLAAVPVVQILGVAGTTAIFTYSCANLLNAVGQPAVTLYIGMASTLLKLVALLMLTPFFGLYGAAVALVLANVVDVTLFLTFTLPRIGVSVYQLATGIVRPLFACAMMVALLWLLGMAWTPSSGSNAIGWIKDAGVRSAIGATIYAASLTAAWFIAGRPDGAEQYLIITTLNIWRRVRKRI